MNSLLDPARPFSPLRLIIRHVLHGRAQGHLGDYWFLVAALFSRGLSASIYDGEAAARRLVVCISKEARMNSEIVIVSGLPARALRSMQMFDNGGLEAVTDNIHRRHGQSQGLLRVEKVKKIKQTLWLPGRAARSSRWCRNFVRPSRGREIPRRSSWSAPESASARKNAQRLGQRASQRDEWRLPA